MPQSRRRKSIPVRRRLLLPQPLPGQHKLWQLPKAVLKVALQGLREPPGVPPFSWRDFGDPRDMLAPGQQAALLQSAGPQGRNEKQGRRH